MPRACQQCSGDLDLSLHDGEARCAHGDAVDRAIRALAHIDDERAAAEERKRQGHPANLQDAGEAFDLAGKREGVSGTYVRSLAKIRDAGRDDLMAAVLERTMRPDQAARVLVAAGDNDDPDTWLTPEHVYAPALREAGGQFHLDPATLEKNPMKAREWYSAQRNEDGLALSWTQDRAGRAIQTIWCNPPYSAIMPWLERAVETVRVNDTTRIWMLIPIATDTAYGQYALQNATSICFLRGRVLHLRADGKPKGSPEFGSMVVGFGAATCAEYREMGTVLAGCAAVAATTEAA